MAKHKETASFHLTLFAVYKRTKKHPDPTFLYTNREGESQRLPFLQAEEENSKAIKSALHRLQPLARRIFASDRHVFKSVPKELATLLVTWAVVSNTWRVMKGKKPWGFLQRFFTDRA